MKQSRDNNISEYWVAIPDGEWILPNEYYEFAEKRDDNDFCALVRKEALGIWNKELGDEAANVYWMRRLRIAEFDPMSDAGHLRYLPRGALIFDLVSDYALHVARKQGAVSVHSSIMYDRQLAPVAEHMKLFGERSYQLQAGNRQFVLRYAACFGQFGMLKDKQFSYRQLPFKLVEVADSYRYERQAEVSGMFRQRRFTMPDMHVFCERDRNLSKAKEQFVKLHKRVLELAEQTGWRYVSLYNVRSDFAEENRSFIRELAEEEAQQVLIRLVPPEKGYYWVINIEYCLVDAQERPVEIATVQMDIGNAERFNIQYRTAEDTSAYPVILHTALVGSIERYIDGVLENAALKSRANGKPFCLPLWLAPIQLRLIPVADRHMVFAEELHSMFERADVRVEIDDRPWRVGRKIRDAEDKAIEYVCVVGDKEQAGRELQVRHRVTGGSLKLTAYELIKRVRSQCEDYPYRPSNLPDRISLFPDFL